MTRYRFGFFKFLSSRSCLRQIFQIVKGIDRSKMDKEFFQTEALSVLRIPFHFPIVDSLKFQSIASSSFPAFDFSRLRCFWQEKSRFFSLIEQSLVKRDLQIGQKGCLRVQNPERPVHHQHSLWNQCKAFSFL